MKKMKLTAAALALVSAIVLGTGAKAAGSGDLILGLYDSTNTVTNSFELDLGSVSSLLSNATANSGSYTFSLGNDISTEFGSSTNSNLEFAISATGGSAGGGGLAAFEIVVTAPTVGGVPGTGVILPGGSNTTNPKVDIASEYSTFNGGSATAIAGSTDGAKSVMNATSYSFKYAEQRSPAPFTLGSIIAPEGVLNSYSSSSVSDLEDFTNFAATATDLGSFQFNTTNNTLTFTQAAAPEPSTYALIGLGALVLLWAKRRSIA